MFWVDGTGGIEIAIWLLCRTYHIEHAVDVSLQLLVRISLEDVAGTFDGLINISVIEREAHELAHIPLLGVQTRVVRMLQGIGSHLEILVTVLMGNNLKAMRLYDEAVACYDRASGMLPNRVYPIYQKMKLYLETGRICQAKRCAHHLLARKPKVQSSATKQMYDEACAVLKH